MHFISTTGGGIQDIKLIDRCLSVDSTSAQITIQVTTHNAIKTDKSIGTTYGSFIKILTEQNHMENFVNDRTVWAFQVSANRNNNDLIVSWGFQ